MMVVSSDTTSKAVNKIIEIVIELVADGFEPLKKECKQNY